MSCEKEDNDPNTEFFVTKITHYTTLTPDNPTIVDFFYDNGEVSGMTAKDNTTTKVFEFEYDNGILKKVNLNGNLKYAFTHNSSNKINNIKTYGSSGTLIDNSDITHTSGSYLRSGVLMIKEDSQRQLEISRIADIGQINYTNQLGVHRHAPLHSEFYFIEEISPLIHLLHSRNELSSFEIDGRDYTVQNLVDADNNINEIRAVKEGVSGTDKQWFIQYKQLAITP